MRPWRGSDPLPLTGWRRRRPCRQARLAAGGRLCAQAGPSGKPGPTSALGTGTIEAYLSAIPV
jgi:hypothetical protein